MMKLTYGLTILLIFCASNAFAICPDLSSTTLTCRSTTGQASGNQNQVITQAEVNGITTYTFNYTSDRTQEDVEQIISADGKSRREMQIDPDSGITLLTVTTAKCSEKSLLIHTTNFIDGQFLGITDTEIKKSGNTITSTIEGMMFGRDIDDVLICE